jgi:hypothetical protein
MLCDKKTKSTFFKTITKTTRKKKVLSRKREERVQTWEKEIEKEKGG